ncbi:hypothetical protein KJ966_17465 [bacterium]|nr:hypothetical protein [bacterium]
MHLRLRQEILTKIYQLYDDFIKDYKLACGIKCSACCTLNVMLTGLEAYRILDQIITDKRDDLLQKLQASTKEERFQPLVSTNEMADLCSQGKNPPEEGVESLLSSCPLLEDKVCSVYENRPFECRSFCSKVNCEEEGMADMDRLVMTVNNVFKQYIEHIDSFGVSGNLIDLMLYLHETGNTEVYLAIGKEAQKPLLSNHPAKVLMVPPEHADKVKPIVEELQRIKIN